MMSCVLSIECAFQSEAAWQSERPKKEQFARNYVDIDHEGSANGCAQSGQQPNKLHQVGVLQELPATSTAPRLPHGRCQALGLQGPLEGARFVDSTSVFRVSRSVFKS